MLTMRRAAVASASARGRRLGGAAARSPVSAALNPPPPPATILIRDAPSSSHAAFAAARPSLSAAGGAASRDLVAAASSSSGPSGSSFSTQAAPQQPPAFGLFRVGGDGACMFRALVQGVQFATRGKPMPPESEATAAHTLRLAVVAELRKRREEMEPFLPGIAADFEEYCQRMSLPMAWGGEPEMAMAVHVIRRPITVYHVTGSGVEPIVTYGDQLLGSVPAISLLWSGAHYDLLLPAGPAGPQGR
ncbi:hypothetical protein HYH03_007879 [Edaphochlamys debaryana]|uniref:Ubiquitin thioesterase OTU n=1 Tax=Edaphochlamys debaryana TaxID=47281 RepID=A0A835Y2B6_9CHLO|nr:hypothetical protein HYH03_007879 [Edaphochlamys debaryana]|eukprot:KAG2493949.1 hypothetical protein HYH03_007879 [Edaphochlamys debaryana]